MRGKDVAAGVHVEGIGITPAYAGKSLRFLRVCLRRRDHPRMCGEKVVSVLLVWIT